jgi:Flp pilus assembly protein TadD
LRVPEIDCRSGPLVYSQLEATYAALGRSRDFEKLLQGLLEKHPDDAGARLTLARTLAARGEIDGAVAELRRRLEDDADGLEAHDTLGRILLAEGRESEACQVLGELLDALDRRGLLRPREKLE